MSKWVLFKPFPPLAKELDKYTLMEEVKEQNEHSLLDTQALNSVHLNMNTPHNTTDIEAKSQRLVPESQYPFSVTPEKKTNTLLVDSLLRSTTSRWRTIDRLQLNSKPDKRKDVEEHEFEIEPTQMDSFTDGFEATLGMTSIGMSAQSQARATQKFDLLREMSPERELGASSLDRYDQEQTTCSQLDGSLVGISYSQELSNNPFLTTMGPATEQKHVQFEITNRDGLKGNNKVSKEPTSQAKTQMLLQSSLPRRSLRTAERQSQRVTMHVESTKSSPGVKLNGSARSQRAVQAHNVVGEHSGKGLRSARRDSIDKQLRSTPYSQTPLVAPQVVVSAERTKHQTPIRSAAQQGIVVNVETSHSKSNKRPRRTTSAETDSIESKTIVNQKARRNLKQKKLQTNTKLKCTPPTKTIECSYQLAPSLLPDALVWAPFIKDGLATNLYCVAQLIKRVSVRREKWKLRAVAAGKSKGNEFVGEDESIVGVEHICPLGVGLEPGDVVYRRGNKDTTPGVFVSWIQENATDGGVTLVRMREATSRTVVTVKLKRLLIDKQLFQSKKAKM